jgi:hypothetical protein
MSQSEKDRDGENDPDRGAVRGGGDSLVEAEHRLTSCRAAGA